jgi:PAS domain S-box-containing protein
MDKRRILLVEDEAIIALTESKTIESFGYEVLCAYSGEAAVQMVGSNKAIDLILMDIDLGHGIDGPEAARKILDQRSIPIVFLTAHSEREMVLKVRGITRYGYIVKNSGNFVLQTSIEMAFELYEKVEETRRGNEAFLQEYYLLSALLDNTDDYVYFKDTKSHFIRASNALAHSFGLDDSSSLIGKTDFDFFTEEHARQAYEDEQNVIKTGQGIIKVEKETRAGQPNAWVSTEKLPLRDKSGTIIGTFGISRDISERKQWEDRLEFRNRLYRTLSAVNRLIVRSKAIDELLIELCSTVVEQGGFRAACIVMKNNTSETIEATPYCCSNNGTSLRSTIDLICMVPWERNPVGLAIRSGHVVLFENPEDIKSGKMNPIDSRSSAAIPFHEGDRGFGALIIYSSATGNFSQDERGLLEEIGMDISYSLGNMAIGKELSEHKLRRSTDEQLTIL